MTAFSSSAALQQQQVLVTTGIPATLQAVQASWRAVEIPVVLITAQLLAACLLLLFLSVGDAIDARGHDVSLAKLRGRGGWQTIMFGMSEPVLLLALALPAGVLAGWAATAAFSRVLLRPGTAVVLPPQAWAAAGLATAGGLLAVVLAARRTLRRPVVEEWRRSGRKPAGRGWIADAVLATAAVAGLLELAVSGQIGSARHGALGLLVPGLLGLAIAVIASRLLPLACRSAFARTSTGGGIGLFLALRHVARRPGGTRTTIVLATAFALSTFAVTAWAVDRNNEHLVAAAEVGAPVVLTVGVPAGKSLGTIVDHADPGGRMAAAVDRYTSLSSSNSGLTVLAVDPQRFARVAAWRPGFTTRPPAELARELAPRAPAPVILSGSALRVTVDVHALSPPGSVLSADVTTGASPVILGPLPARGATTLTAPLVGCPCVLQDLDLTPPRHFLQSPVTGSVTINAVQVRGAADWVPAAAGLLSAAARWRPGHLDNPPDRITDPRPDWTGRSPGTAAPGLPSRLREPALPAARGGVQRDAQPRRAARLRGGARRQPARTAGDQRRERGAGNAASRRDRGPPVRRARGRRELPGRQPAGMARRRGPGQHRAAAEGRRAAGAVGEHNRVGGRGLRPARTRPGQRAVPGGRGGRGAAGRRGGRARPVRLRAPAPLRVRGALGVRGGHRHAPPGRPDRDGPGARLRRRHRHRQRAARRGAGPAHVPEFLITPAAPLSYVPAAAPLVVLLGGAVVLLAVAAVTASVLLIRGVSLDQLRETPT